MHERSEASDDDDYREDEPQTPHSFHMTNKAAFSAHRYRRPVVRVGIQLPEVEREVRWPEVAAIARAAEESKFDSIWVGDHLLYRGGGKPERGPWDAWTQLAALAVLTTGVRLGPLVAATAFHSPG